MLGMQVLTGSRLHYPYRLTSVRALEPIPADIGRRQVHPGPGHLDRSQVISGLMWRQTTIHAHIHTYGTFRDKLTSLHVFGRKLENPEGTHTATGRTCCLHT